MLIKHLKGHEYANCKVKMTGDDIILHSYSTDVIIVSDDWMYITGLYSATTRKHIGWFMREYFGLSYQFAKELHSKQLAYNVKTKETKRMVWY